MICGLLNRTAQNNNKKEAFCRKTSYINYFNNNKNHPISVMPCDKKKVRVYMWQTKRWCLKPPIRQIEGL